VLTMRRGKIVVEGGRLSSQPAEGKRLERRVDSRVLSGPLR